jgi:hypothetical protein
LHCRTNCGPLNRGLKSQSLTKAGAAAQMSDITPGEQVSGSYWKKEDGTLAAKSVKLGAKKTEAAAPATNAQKKEDHANASSPSASPRP